MVLSALDDLEFQPLKKKKQPPKLPGWNFRDLQYDEEGNITNFIADSPTGRTYFKNEFDQLDLTKPEVGQELGSFLRPALQKKIQAGEPIEPEAQALGKFPVAQPDLSNLITKLYPSYGYKPEEILKTVQTQIQLDPEQFLRELQLKNMPVETEALLKILGADQELINQIVTPQQKQTQLVQTINNIPEFKGYDIESLSNLIETNPQQFYQMLTTGITPAKRDLMRLVGFTEDEITAIIRTPRAVGTAIDKGQLAIEAEARETAKRGKGRLFTAGVGDLVANVGGMFKWAGAEGIGQKITQAGQFMQVQALPMEKGEFKWQDLFDPSSYSFQSTMAGITRSLPTLMTLAIPGIGAYGLAGSVAAKVGIGAFGRAVITGIGGSALSRPLESAMEAAQSYDDARNRGLSDEEAKKAANKVFTKNLTLVGSDVAQLTAAFLPTPFGSAGSIVRRGLVKTAQVGGKLVFTGLTEGGEEIYQDILQRQARGEKVKLDPDMQQVFAIGAVMGLGMGGGGDILMRVTDKVAIGFTPQQKVAFDSEVQNNTAQGLDEKASKLQAMDTVVKDNPELVKATQQATKEVEKEVTAEALEAEKAKAVEPIPAKPVTPAPTPITEGPAIAPEVTQLKQLGWSEQRIAELDAGERASIIRHKITPEAAKEVAPPVTPAPEVTKARTYWDTKLENNPLRVGRKDTDAGAFLSVKIENAGDILREYIGNKDTGYMREKFNRLIRELDVRDWRDTLSEGEQTRLTETKALLEKLPAPDETTKVIKDLITSITNRDVKSIKANLEKLEPLLFKPPTLPTPEAGMPPSVSVQTGLPGMGVTEAQAKFFEEVSGVTGRKVPLTQVPQTPEVLEGQQRFEEAQKAVEEAPAEAQEAYEAQAEVEGLKYILEVDPIAQLRFKIGERATGKGEKRKVVSRMVGIDQLVDAKEKTFAFNDSFTSAQARAIKPNAVFSEANKLPNGRIRADAVLDELAQKYTGGDVQALIDRVNQIRQEKERIKEAQDLIRTQMTEKPLETIPEPTPTEVEQLALIPGKPKYNMKQIDALVGFFADYINEPTTVRAWELTRELRRETRAGRAENLKARAQELVVSKGINAEEAMKQAISETLSGELPTATTEYFEGLTADLRDALFAKVYHVLKEEPFEMASTVTALTHALTGKAIPREPGIKGGSAYTRLQRVFGDQPKVLKAIDKMATDKKPLKDVVEGIYHETGREPIPIDQDTAEYLRGLADIPFGQIKIGEETFAPKGLSEQRTAEEIARGTLELRLELAKQPQAVTRIEAPIEDGAKQIRLLPRPARDNIIQVLKEIGMLPVDIGNFLRANKASFDFSFWRQQAPLIASHPITFVQANVEAWKALWSQKSSEASWQRITRDPIYQIYEEAANQGGDFLRPLELKKGTAQWRGVEEFGYLTGERQLPKLTAKLPWVKLSARAFETGTNVHNWLIFKNYYQAMLRLNEQYASGKKTFKVGEAFDMTKEMVDFSRSLANFTARGSLGKFAATAPELSGLFFAPRAAIGRILSVKDLINANPRVRMEAWKNAATFVSTFGGIVLMGAAMDWWEVEKDPRNAEYMSIRIGNTRIDPWGGYRQFLVFFTRAITQTGVSSVTGAEYEVDPINLIQTFIRGKASPLASLILDFWRGKNFIGEEVDITNKAQWAERIAPFALWDIYEAYKDDPITALQVAIPAIVGAGVQTYTGDWRENFPKLGLPKYSDNLAYGLTEPKYDTADFWTDTFSQFKGVDPATLTPQKGYPPYIRAIAEARLVNEHLDTLPSERLVSLNADPTKGITFAQYYQMWRDREKLAAAGDAEKLAEFDKDERTRNAHLGNFSQRQFALLNEYWAITDKKKQAEFLKDHPELLLNSRTDYLKTHPKENAQLAVWGQAKILTKEAYNQFKGMVKSLDIPDSALPELTLPPEGSIDNYFKYQDMVAEDKNSSWEAQLMLAKDTKLRDFLGLKPSDTPIASLELKVKNRANFDTISSYSDEDSPQYIADDKKRAEAVKKFKADNPGFVDDTRRIEAIEKGTDKVPTPEPLIKSHVDYGKIQDKEGVGSSSAESMLFRVDNPEYDKWRTDSQIWGDSALKPVDQTKIPIWRIDVKWDKEDKAYTALGDINDKEFYIADDKRRAEARASYLQQNPEYRKDRRRREAYGFVNPSGVQLPTTQVENYVSYYELPAKGYRQERFLLNNPDFAQAVGKTIPLRVPSEQYDILSEQYEQQDDEYQAILDRYDTNQTKEQAQATQEYLKKNPEYAKSRYAREGYKLYVPDNQIENYVGYKTLPSGTYEQDWFMMEHQDFYREVYLGVLKKDRLDFRKTPTREVYAKYLEYQKLPTDYWRDLYRQNNSDLDEWGQLRFGWKPIPKQGERKPSQRDITMGRITQADIEFDERMAALRGAR